jgi:hypothetical protein
MSGKHERPPEGNKLAYSQDDIKLAAAGRAYGGLWRPREAQMFRGFRPVSVSRWGNWITNLTTLHAASKNGTLLDWIMWVLWFAQHESVGQCWGRIPLQRSKDMV